ncbi:Glucuronokinase 1 [Holothuria leucospilota]|uniref:Glucuronokinase 1 n=1 Tax=Holothuria leucospilota TaxID=206669 RepID=A0A9Q1H5L8_HOLLE|nr:Glucuronokinase 1 [Holothuria leucospilota]
MYQAVATYSSSAIMICIILVAGHGKHLELQIKRDVSGKYSSLEGVPKALLPGVGGKKILDFWWKAVNTRQLFSEVFLVTNADKYKYFERWATANDFPVDNIINDGTTTFDSRLGSVGDFDLVLRNKNVQDDVLLVAGDMLFQDHKFDILQVVHYFKKKSGELAIYYEMEDTESCTTRGIVEVCHTTNRITKFYEKPKEGDTASRLASVVFYCFRRETLPTIPQYLENHPDINERNFGNYMQWLVNDSDIPVYGVKLPTGFQLIGQVTLADYEKWLTYFSDERSSQKTLQPFTSKAYARIGLMGNPSDGFHGKTISLSIKNFWAEVTIIESKELVLVPHPLNDPTEFGSLGDLHGISRKEGYFGGLRLLQATCKKFYQYCSEQGIVLPKRNFTLKYDTNIPRQVGLAGSSAIVTATLRCLMHFFDITDMDMKRPLQPQFILSVEVEELFISAGLQDRVIQVYEGLVHMDFSENVLKQYGHGCYSELDMSLLPPLWLAYIRNPSDSGKIHSTVTERWRNGDTEVIEGMLKFAELTDQARQALEEHDYNQFKELMDLNFDQRWKLYGDDVIGAENLQMIDLARQFGSSAKFSGSGGAVIGYCPDQDKLSDLKRAFQMQGFVVCDVIPNPPAETNRKDSQLN